jgi:membrane protease YdiL (CAAX protease family)
LELGINLAKLFFVNIFNEEPTEKFSEFGAPEITLPEEPAPNNPPWSSIVAFGVWLASVAFVVLIPNLFILPYVAKQNIDFLDREKLLEFVTTDKTAVLLQVSAIVLAHLLTIALAWFIITKFNKFSFRQVLGWRWGGFTFWKCVLITGSFFALAGITSYFIPEQDNDLLRIIRSSREALYLVAFLATFTAPLVEEVIYRGILYSAFQKTFGVGLAILFVTIVFAGVHIPQYYPSYSTIFLICLLSLVLTLIRVWTGNLLPCIVLHTIFNGIQSLVLVLQTFLPQQNSDSTSEPFAFFIHLIN